jgi:hypothetical protein
MLSSSEAQIECVNGSAERTENPTNMRGGQPPIEILTGADEAGNFYIGNIFELRCGLVVMQTWFGWVIIGKA